MNIKEVKPGVEVIVVLPMTAKDDWPIGVIKTVAYTIGDSDWLCTLENGDVVKVKDLLKLDI